MLEYTDHAAKRMRQRRISEDDVKYCINNPDIRYTDPKGNPIYKSVLPSGKGIKVVIEAGSSDPLKIITVADY
jgi:hypothetical protein